GYHWNELSPEEDVKSEVILYIVLPLASLLIFSLMGFLVYRKCSRSKLTLANIIALDLQDPESSAEFLSSLAANGERLNSTSSDVSDGVFLMVYLPPPYEETLTKITRAASLSSGKDVESIKMEDLEAKLCPELKSSGRPSQDHHRAGMMWVVDHSQQCSDPDVVVVWTVRDDSSSAAAQGSVGHPLVLHQWSQDADPQDSVGRIAVLVDYSQSSSDTEVSSSTAVSDPLTPAPHTLIHGQGHCSAENDPPPTSYLLCGGPVEVLAIEEQGNRVYRETDGLQSVPVELQRAPIRDGQTVPPHHRTIHYRCQ
ncbi:hypothetical protein NFI96_028655, partial [Prochilodus magdalenae]